MAGLLLLVFVLLGSCFVCLGTQSNHVHSFYGIESALSQAHVDPLAQNDSFLSLSPSQKRGLVQSGSLDTHTKIQSLMSLSFTIPITVKLVGFSSYERTQLENKFSHYIDIVSRDEKAKVVGGDTHELVVSTRATVVVELGKTDMADTIYDAIEKQLAKKGAVVGTQLGAVDYRAVDDVIRQDVSKNSASYNIYILNLRKQARQYAYSYQDGEQPSFFTRCLGSLWTGSERYLWIDLAAGPVEYGPALSGEGLLPRGDAHPLATLHSNRHGKTFIADLASLVWSSKQMLLSPSLRVPVHFETDIEVHFIHVQGSEQVPDVKGVDLQLIKRTFIEESNNGLLLQHQRLKFHHHVIKMYSCSVCVAAISRSMRSFTARFHFENYTLIVSEYLDSKQLHWSLRHSKHDLLTRAGVPHSSSGRIVPVYIFDVEYERSLLLDRFHQAMAFRDMVIAVRTKSSQGVSDYTCNGRHVITQNRQLERPIVGALLQTLWGVAPTHLRWSTQHNSSIIDYTWAVGQTPFGPFSDLLSLSFVQKDAAPRNTLFTLLNVSVSSALEVLESVRAHGGERKLLGSKRHIEFTQRWNVFRFKIEKALSALSHFEFDNALYFMKSSDHDLLQMHRLAYDAAAELQSHLVCFQDPPFPWWPIMISVFILTVMFYIWIRREKLFYSKKKRF